MISITTKVKEKEWREFLEKSESATIYHTPEWKNVLEKSFEYKPFYLFAKDECGMVVGLFPLFNIRSRITKNRLCSVPFSHICAPIGDENVLNALINEGINLYKYLGVDYLEIRDCIDFDGFQHQNAYFTYMLELSKNVEDVWKKLKRDVRKGIGKADRNNLVIESAQDTDNLKEFYNLNCMTKKKIGVPSHPLKFFENLFKFLSDSIKLYVVNYKNEIICGGIVISYKNKALYGYSAANPKYLKLYPYNAFRWKSIKDACLRGYEYLDFGRASCDNVGLIDYKKRWGTIEKKLYYSYYPKNPESLTENRENFKYRLGTKVIRRMPMPIYKKFSDVVFGNFG